MIDYVSEIIDKTGRKIRLTRKQWSHIKRDHPNIESPREISKTIQNPDKVITDEREDVNNFYKYFKHKKQKSKFLKIIVKYLNGQGFIITAHFVRYIR